MEGDIFLDDKYELWLDLVKVEFYKNNKLYMLFDEIGGIPPIAPLFMNDLIN